MEIGSIGRDYSARSAKPDSASTATDAASALSDPSSPKDAPYDRLVHGLTSLNKATDEAEEQAKARAKQKLDDAKQQLDFMRRWGSIRKWSPSRRPNSASWSPALPANSPRP